MSFMLTTEQARKKAKTVTRRLGWWFLHPGDIVQQVEKSMGLKKGERIKKIHLIKIIKTHPESLDLLIDPAFIEYAKTEMVKEGFPDMAPEKFVEMFCKHNRCKPHVIINRIEFEYL